MVGIIVVAAVEAVSALAGDLQDVRIGVDKDLGQLGLRARGDVVGLRAVAVIVGGVQAELTRGLVHAGDERALAAADVLGHGDARGAGRRDHDQVQQGLDRVGGAFGQRHSGRIVGVARFDRRVVADADRRGHGQAAGLQLLKDDVGGEHLGHAGRHARHIPVIGVELLAGVGVHDEHAGGLEAQRRGKGHRAAAAQHSAQQDCEQSFFHTETPFVVQRRRAAQDAASLHSDVRQILSFSLAYLPQKLKRV